MNETKLSPLSITVLERYPLSVIASFLTEVEGTRFFLTRKEWSKQLLPLFRLPVTSAVTATFNPTRKGNQDSDTDSDSDCDTDSDSVKRYKYRHKFVVVPVQDATTRLARLNTRRWKLQKLPVQCSHITIEEFYTASLPSADVAQTQKLERAPNLGYPPILRFLHPSKLHSPFRPGTTLLASYPRSGNTLLRSLLESITGYVTGSDTRPDRPLSLSLAEGHDLVGEGITQPSQTAIVKTHWPERIGYRKYNAHRVILLVRNPFDAIDSYWNLNVTNTHTAKVTDQVYDEHAAFFAQLALNEIKVWINFLEYWTSQSAPLLWVRYEDLILDPQRELLRILEFSTFRNEYYWCDRVQLVLQQQQGHGYRSRNPRTPSTPSSTQRPSQEKKCPFGQSLKRYSKKLLEQMHDLDDHGWLLKLGYHIFLQDFPNNVMRRELPPLPDLSLFESDTSPRNTIRPRLVVNHPVEHDLRPLHCPFGRNMREWRRKHTYDDSQPFPTA